ncbi:MAG: hypothetical protein HY241_06625 [Actinobacteria bacterium]|nr:hypothetical protein [Actinomycetota bacterium]
MELAADGFGTDKPEETVRAANGFVFPRDMDRPARDRGTVRDLGDPAREVPRAEPSRSDSVRSEVPRPEPSRPEVPRSELGRPETGRPEAARADRLSRPTERLRPRTASISGETTPAVPAAGEHTGGHDWFRPQPGSPAEHPLMRGLLLELPPRADAPDKAWLEQWLEAARATLELIYSRADGPAAR